MNFAMRTVLLCGALSLMGCGTEQIPVPGTPLTQEELLDPIACADCHPDQYREWKGSMHAYAAEDPVFRAMNARGQREADLGDFCISCHAPMAVRLGLTTDGLNMDEVPVKYHGVTCYFCHQAISVDGTHNAPLTLAGDATFRGSIADPVANQAHGSMHGSLQDRDQLADSSALCGACHDIVTPAGVHLERTYLEWRGSLYSREDDVQKLSCGDCHMAGVNRLAAQNAPGVKLRRSKMHTFQGVDVALTEWPERDTQRALVQDFLEDTILPDLCVYPSAESTTVFATLENIAAGHSFPSGASQDRRAWLEVRAFSKGNEVFTSGIVADDQALADALVGDSSIWWFGETICDADCNEVHMFWEAAPATNPDAPECAKCISRALIAPIVASPLDPGFVDPHQFREYSVPQAEIDRVEMVFRVRPMRLDVLDELVAGGDLDAAVRDAMPTFTLESTRLVWTPDLGTPCVQAN
ncbi:MAG: hypothetical protein ACI9WU_004021 [Myxococcota bacterium]|jgi:hypothetical protein